MGIAIDASGRFLYVAEQTGSRVTRIELGTNGIRYSCARGAGMLVSAIKTKHSEHVQSSLYFPPATVTLLCVACEVRAPRNSAMFSFYSFDFKKYAETIVSTPCLWPVLPTTSDDNRFSAAVSRRSVAARSAPRARLASPTALALPLDSRRRLASPLTRPGSCYMWPIAAIIVCASRRWRPCVRADRVRVDAIN